MTGIPHPDRRRAIVRRATRLFVLCLCTAGALAFVAPARAQKINSISGPLTLRIESAAPGSDPDPVTDSSSSISYTAGLLLHKITASTSCPGQSYALSVRATVTSGSGTGDVERVLVHNGVVDVITGIEGLASGVATLTYQASATAADGHSGTDGDDLYTITYTITQQ